MIQCENCHGPGSAHQGAPSADNINVDRDPYISCYGFGTSGCHSGTRQWGTDEIPGWNASAHAPHDNDPETDHGMNTYCASCKSPSQWDPEASRSTGVDIPKAEYRGITCGDCHDPHNDTGHIGQLKWPVEESCDACHNGGHHETMRTPELSGEPSVLRDDYPYMEEVECVECHMFQTSRGVPEPWKKVGHYFEASYEACVYCHTDIYDNMPDVDYDEGNATSMEEWDAWGDELQDHLDEWEHVVHAAQERHEALLEIIEGTDTETGLLEEVEELMEVAEGNGTWTEELEHLFEQAEFDWELAEHNAKGAHNPAYGIALLNAAIDGFEEIIEELEMGTIKGKVSDETGAGVANAYITVNGHGTKTDADGMYMVMVEGGTYDVSAFILGYAEKTQADVSIHSAEVVVQNFTLAPDFDRDGTADADDTDDDNDGVLDDADAFDNDPTEWTDTDGDGIGNNEDTDDDADGVPDTDDKAPLDATVDTKISDLSEDEEAETPMMYLILIIVLIVIVLLLLVMYMKKGSGSSSPPPEPEPEPEPPVEEEIEEEA
jgi:hypothetical protein